MTLNIPNSTSSLPGYTFMDRRLIDHFVNANLISRQDMQRIILRASKDKTSLIQELLNAQLLHEDVVAQHIASYYGKETLSAQGFRVDPIALNLITGDLARGGGLLPYSFSAAQDQLYVALYDPEGAQEVLDILERTTGVPPELRFAPKTWVEEAIEHYYFRPLKVTNAAPSSTFSGASRRGANAVLRSTFIGERSRGRKAAPSKKAQTVDDLDDFLAEPSRPNTRSSQMNPSLRGSQNPSNFGDMSGLGASFWEDGANSISKWGDNTPAAPAPKKDAAFSLFEENPASEDLTLKSVIERQQERISKLNEELQRQRNVIQSLADLLVEARVISARELKRRVRDKRR